MSHQQYMRIAGKIHALLTVGLRDRKEFTIVQYVALQSTIIRHAFIEQKNSLERIKKEEYEKMIIILKL